MTRAQVWWAVGCIIGTIAPWMFFGSFFAANGLNLQGFVVALFTSAPAGGFTTDLLISLVFFWIWSFLDARSQKIIWWPIPLASICVGLSLAFPLYMLIREGGPSHERN